jgi:hypothetical protein
MKLALFLQILEPISCLTGSVRDSRDRNRSHATCNTQERRKPSIRKHNPTSRNSGSFIPGRRYRSLHGKVVDWVEHSFEERFLYVYVRFTDKAELCWHIATRMTMEEGDLSDWKSGDFKQLRVFVRNEQDRSL